jgi:hypothetical protein
MKLQYAVKFDDFQKLQRQFTIRTGNNAGFKAALAACSLMPLLGIFCLVIGMGPLVGSFLIAMGIVAAALAYLYERRTVSAKKEALERNVKTAFQKIHCRDERFFEADKVGFTFGCKCETVTRPWSELISFSENEAHFSLGTKAGGQILPKSAFPSQAEVTEFRGMLGDRLHSDQRALSPSIDFALKPEDYRRAHLLHIIKGGGWRSLLKASAKYIIMAYGCLAVSRYVAEPRDRGILSGLMAIFVLGPTLVRMVRRRRRHNFSPLQIHFNQYGFHVHDRVSQSRISWARFVGYLEDDSLLLLYYSPKLYWMIPKRALTGHADRFRELLVRKVPKFDYHNPKPEGVLDLSISPQKTV